MSKVFDTDKRIRLGIWGLGRGMNFFSTCRAVHLDVVAGCDLNEDMCKTFSAHNPGAYVTTSADEFLAQDFDAVLLATYAIGHADHAIQCLKAGKHVLSEVIAFFTLEEGVRLVEAVEESGLVYQLAENYPFSPVNRFLARKWQEGLFGPLMYGEFGYVHECRSLGYTYGDGKPVRPGNEVHNWRSWLNYHYYCTHSLGPVMVITGARPTKVTSLASTNPLPGYIKGHEGGMGNIATSLITMSDGGVVRNLMGSVTDDGCVQRLMGTRGAVEINRQGLWFRLGGGGASPKFKIEPDMSDMDRMALGTGHGGGDFWVLYYFAREILSGEKGPFDVYSSADVTLPGILACRSSLEGGTAFDVPNLRNKAERDLHRNNDWHQERYDTTTVFPAGADISSTGQFSEIMKSLCDYTEMVRAFIDWTAMDGLVDSEAPIQERVVEPLLADIDNVAREYRRGRKLADEFPGSDATRVINEMLELGDEKAVIDGTIKAQVAARCAELRKASGIARTYLTPYQVSSLKPKPASIDLVPFPASDEAFGDDIHPLRCSLDLRDHHGKQDGFLYVRTRYHACGEGTGKLMTRMNAGFKLWINGEFITSVGVSYNTPLAIQWLAGDNEIVVAIDTLNGKVVTMGMHAEEDVKKTALTHA